MSMFVHIFIYLCTLKRIQSGTKWTLIRSAEDPEQEWLYSNPQNSCFGHKLMSPITRVNTLSWSPYLQLQNAKLTLSNFPVTSSFIRELYMHWLSLFSGIVKQNQINSKIMSQQNKKQNYCYYHYDDCYHYCRIFLNAVWQIYYLDHICIHKIFTILRYPPL